MDPIKVGIATSLLLVVIGAKFFFPSIPDDNPVEEAAEEMLKQQTGIDIDITPSSKEK